MKILVTGCAGFIGTTFTRLLLEKGWLVYGIDKFTYVANFEEVQWLADTYPDTFTYTVEDIKDIDRLPECDVVFNLAAESDVDNSIMNIDNFIDSNISSISVGILSFFSGFGAILPLPISLALAIIHQRLESS